MIRFDTIRYASYLGRTVLDRCRLVCLFVRDLVSIVGNIVCTIAVLVDGVSFFFSIRSN